VKLPDPVPQLVAGPGLSIEQVRVAVGSDENVNVGVLSAVSALGPEWMVAPGGVRSIVHV
jgi:hypothetical protein